MKILKNGVSNRAGNSQKQVCYDCDCEFEYDESDIRSDDECKFVICPWCNNKIILNWLKKPETKIYPDMFFETFDAVKMAKEDINEMCKRVFDNLEDLKEETDYCYEMTGDTIVFGVRDEDGINLFVARDYEEATYDKDKGWLED